MPSSYPSFKHTPHKPGHKRAGDGYIACNNPSCCTPLGGNAGDEADEPVTVIAKTPAVTYAIPAPPKGWDVVEPSAEPNETFWRQARNECGMRDPQLAVETHEEEERAYARSLQSVRKIAGVLAVAVAVAVTGLAGCHRKPAPTLADVVTVAQYPDGTFSVDAYGPDGKLLTSAHLAKDAKLADVFPVGCQPDDGDEPCGLSN
jgi:hypothetical protein